jgi:hypothetical protein
MWKSLPSAVATSPAPMRIARRRGHLTPWTTPVSMSFVANGDGFIGASLQGLVVTCCLPLQSQKGLITADCVCELTRI